MFLVMFNIFVTFVITAVSLFVLSKDQVFMLTGLAVLV